MSLERILCVEDDRSIQEVARIALETVGGMEVDIASSGQDALQRVSDFNPDLILLDVMMPCMDGPETLTRLQEEELLGNTPVVFLTARTQKEEVAKYLELGAVGVIAKPFDPMTLAQQVRDIWAQVIEQRE